MSRRAAFITIVAAIFSAYVFGILVGRIGWEPRNDFEIPCGPSEVAVWDEYPETIRCEER